MRILGHKLVKKQENLLKKGNRTDDAFKISINH